MNANSGERGLGVAERATYGVRTTHEGAKTCGVGTSDSREDTSRAPRPAQTPNHCGMGGASPSVSSTCEHTLELLSEWERAMLRDAHDLVREKVGAPARVGMAVRVELWEQTAREAGFIR